MSVEFTWSEFIAGWTAGIIGLTVGHPADTIKVLQQMSAKMDTKTLIIHTYKHDGVRGFYRGLMFPVLGAGAMNAIFFGVYGNTLRSLQKWHGQEPGRHTCHEAGPAYRWWHLDVFLAGCLGGFAQISIACPTELIKVRLQAEMGKETSSTKVTRHKAIHCAKDIYQSGGWRGFYRGFHAVVWRDVMPMGMFVLTYEHALSMRRIEDNRSLEYSVVDQLVAGGLAGVVSWGLAIPADVVKSRLQADSYENPKYKGMVDCIIKSYREAGAKVFWRGLPITILRAFPVNAASFVGFEFCYKMCQQVGDRWTPKPTTLARR